MNIYPDHPGVKLTNCLVRLSKISKTAYISVGIGRWNGNLMSLNQNFFEPCTISSATAKAERMHIWRKTLLKKAVEWQRALGERWMEMRVNLKWWSHTSRGGCRDCSLRLSSHRAGSQITPTDLCPRCFFLVRYWLKWNKKAQRERVWHFQAKKWIQCEQPRVLAPACSSVDCFFPRELFFTRTDTESALGLIFPRVHFAAPPQDCEHTRIYLPPSMRIHPARSTPWVEIFCPTTNNFASNFALATPLLILKAAHEYTELWDYIHEYNMECCGLVCPSLVQRMHGWVFSWDTHSTDRDRVSLENTNSAYRTTAECSLPASAAFCDGPNGLGLQRDCNACRLQHAKLEPQDWCYEMRDTHKM